MVNFIKRFLIIDKVRIYFEYNIHCFHVIARGISAMAITELQTGCNNVAFSYKNVRIIIIKKGGRLSVTDQARTLETVNSKRIFTQNIDDIPGTCHAVSSKFIG